MDIEIVEMVAEAAKALRGYDDAGEVMLRDLLCDLMHFCDANDLDFHKELGRASRHYEDEIAAPILWGGE